MLDDADIERFREGRGPVVTPAKIAAPAARAMVDFLAAHDDVGVQLVEVRQSGDRTWIAVNVDVDVGQAPKVDIRASEPIMIGFKPANDAWPEVVSLRADFPFPLPHLFVRPADEPVGLCLSEANWVDVRRRWTPMMQCRLLRTWLIDTARGALHREEQPLEPFLPGSAIKLIVPHDLFAETGPAMEALYGYGVGEPGQPGLVIRFVRKAPDGLPLPSVPRFVAAGFAPPARTHGIIQTVPRTIEELVNLLQAQDFDFAAALDTTVRAWLARKDIHGASPVLFVRADMTRAPEQDAERSDLWAFLVDGTVVDLAVSLDLWSTAGSGGPVLAGLRKATGRGADTTVAMTNPSFELSSQTAAACHGYDAPIGAKILAVGAGALGSQVIANLARMGETISGIADNDRLMPHNLARHAAWDSSLLGWPKAEAMALMVNRLRPDQNGATAFFIDAVEPKGEATAKYRQALQSADVVLDLAASVPVSRQLAAEAAEGRRVSAFLSPNGRDLVILAEDRARSVRLDHLELNYYASIVNDLELADHLRLPGAQRYARSCRDVSAMLPQTALGAHAATAAESIRSILSGDSAAAVMWRLNLDQMTTCRIPLDARAMTSLTIGKWTVLISATLFEALRTARAQKLPRETGGVLLGDFDIERRQIYLGTALPSPRDSEETATSYVRGSFGLQDAVDEARRKTLDMLQYVGEWHSHPDGAGVDPSEHDKALYAHLAREMEIEGYPPIMVIVSEGQFALIVDGHFSPAGDPTSGVKS